ncbi:MAG: ParB/RepB/Spo0J family partition protein [Oscillospiraceae bacterium]|nr:ParB/RepB/Spo0J family partition protein [Oscillospiraceae bacterium]
MATKKGLGTGLGALFGDDPALSPADTLPISRVEPRSGQPRTNFDEPALQELADSIGQHGLLQPITVRRLDGGYYQIIAGERRWRAARMAGLTEIPVRIIEADDRKAQELALVENLQREDLNPMEEARGYRALMDDFGLTQELVSQQVGKSRPTVANALRLLSLPKELIELVEKGQLTTGHARALLPIGDKAVQLEAARQVVEKELSVRQTEALAAALMKKSKEPEAKKAPEVDYAAHVSAQLGQALGRKVHIVDGRKKGRIELEYYGADDREALLAALFTLQEMNRGEKDNA